jgi:hypothetical protein
MIATNLVIQAFYLTRTNLLLLSIERAINCNISGA